MTVGHLKVMHWADLHRKIIYIYTRYQWKRSDGIFCWQIMVLLEFGVVLVGLYITIIMCYVVPLVLDMCV